MKQFKPLVQCVGIIVCGAMLASCGGPTAFTKGEYDDPARVELLDDKFNEADMQQMADTMVKAMVSCAYIANAKRPPIVIVDRIANRTKEHIDTESITEKIATALGNSGKVQFGDKELRSAIDEEMKYQESGAVSEVTRKKRGQQTAADHLFSGTLAQNVQEVGDNKLVYYKLKMKLTNIETGLVECTEEREVRKKFRKRSISF
jgi:uncharacterized protein (TIGR02722 family)